MKEFDEYTSKFDLDNKMMKLKYNHSYRVKDISNLLAKKLRLDEENIKLATLIGLLHDIGRFEQIKKYGTYSDINTIDHGDFGAYLLFNKGLISNFTIDVQNYDIIKECVKCHNKYCIDNEKMYDEKTLTQLKIIRDADKLDILNIFANLNETDVNSDGSISKEVENQFFNNEILDNRSKKTNADKIIGIISYIYDINFKESFEYIKQQDFIEKIYDRIEDKKMFKQYFEHAKNYIEQNLK